MAQRTQTLVAVERDLQEAREVIEEKNRIEQMLAIVRDCNIKTVYSERDLMTLDEISFGKGIIHTTEQAETVWRVLASGKMSSLQKLDLKNITINDAGTAALWRALVEGEGLRCLRQLDLSTTQIGDEGAAALGQALIFSKLPALECLNLSTTQIGDEGVMALAEGLVSSKLPALQELNLKRTRIGQTGHQRLQEVMPQFGLVEYYGKGTAHWKRS